MLLLRFIHDTALRKTMLKAHLQAWVWQDEWYGLNMEVGEKNENGRQLSQSDFILPFAICQDSWENENGRHSAKTFRVGPVHSFPSLTVS